MCQLLTNICGRGIGNKSVSTCPCKVTYTVSQKNVLTLKRYYSSKLQGAILMKFGRNIQNTLE